MAPAVVIHTSLPLAPLPASDVESIRLLATIRAGGVDAAVTTAEWTASGKPFVSLNGKAVPASQFSHLSSYHPADRDLSSAHKADTLAWSSYIEAQVTDLIYHSLYSLPPNYPYLAGAQVAALPFPLNHYVPQRLRGIHRARLEAVGLWGVAGVHHGDAVEEDRKRLEESIIVAPGGTKTERKWSGWNAGREAAERSRKFGEEKLRLRAKTAFDPLARLLGSNTFFFGRRPTSIDIALFSNLTLVLSTDLPNPLLADYLRAEFPTLVAHHDAVLASLWPRGWGSIKRVTPPASPSLASSLRSYLPSWAGGPARKSDKAPREPGSEMEEKQMRSLSIGRYLWFAGAGAAFIAYALMSGLVAIEFGGDDEEYEDDEEDGDEVIEIVGYDELLPNGLPVWEDDEEHD